MYGERGKEKERRRERRRKEKKRHDFSPFVCAGVEYVAEGVLGPWY